MIRIYPDTSRAGPTADGLNLSASEWRLDPGQYHGFIETVTGIAPPDDPTASDCYRIGNRIEAFVEEHHRLDEWTPTLVEEYPDVESLAEILGLARFFRQCHACRVDEA